MHGSRVHRPRRGRRPLPGLIVLLIAGLLAFTGCDDDDIDSTSEPVGVDVDAFLPDATLADQIVPEFWVLGSEDPRLVTVEVEFPDGVLDEVRRGLLDRPVVTLRIQREGDSTARTVPMYDDGGALPVDGDEFVGDTSGDLVPGDGRYAVRMNSGFATGEGEHAVEILLTSSPLFEGADDSPAITELGQIAVTVTGNDPPDIETVNVPATLPSGFTPQTWTIVASDPNELSGDEIEAVEVLLDNSSNTTVRNFLFADAGDSTWTYQADSSFSAGLAQGDYSFIVQARDRFGVVGTATHALTIENFPPVLGTLVSPDTVYQADTPETPNLYLFTLEVTDPQSAADIQRVYYTVTDPGGNLATSDDFIFRDDGEDLDEIAGDGTWTHGFIVTDGVSNFGTYTFRFYALDRGGNVSNEIPQEIELRPNTEN